MIETERLTGAGWILLGLGAALALGVLVVVVRAPSDTRLRSWASRYGLELTEANRPVVAGYVRRTRIFQTAGAAIGWLASPVYVGIIGRPFPLGGNWVVLTVGGFLLGAVTAEATFLRRPRAGAGVRSAALVPRALPDYLPSATTWALRIPPLLTVGIAALYAAVPKDLHRSADEPGVVLLLVVSIMLVGFAVVVEGILRAIVARPQPVVSHDLVGAEDAIRASSIHTLSAAAVAVLLLGAGWALVTVGTVTSIEPLRQVMLWLGVVTDVMAVVAWVALGHPRAWRVQHQAPQPR